MVILKKRNYFFVKISDLIQKAALDLFHLDTYIWLFTLLVMSKNNEGDVKEKVSILLTKVKILFFILK